jgi:predicted  nucleic acid-binding Zn-ribbon protein
MTMDVGRPDLAQWVRTAEAALDDIKEDIREARGIQQRLQDQFIDLQKDIPAQLMEIHKAVIAIGKPQYTVISGFAGVVLLASAGLWGLAVGPINDKIADNKTSISKLESDFRLLESEKESRTDIEGLRADLKSKIEELTTRLKRQ